MNKLLFVAILFCFGNNIPILAQVTGLETGNKAPEISLPTPKGDLFSLSSLRGKLVLVDFWGSWCSPCVEEQSDLARLYLKYNHSKFKNGSGFEIYGVSLDAQKVNWENSINNLKISWVQVSDLKFWRSPVAKTYHIQALPFNLLIDGNGIILAKNLHGAELENEILKYRLK
jgi:peroxiredoxin